MKALIGTVQNGKEWTEQDYKLWRLNQIGRGRRYEALREKIAQRMTNAHETAIAYVNDATPGIYSLNRNYAAYTIERVAGNVDFTLWDEQTVRRLIVEQPDLMPYYPKAAAVKRGIDLEYGKKQITKCVTSSVLQGKSIKGISDDLQRYIPTMSRDSAIRAARTAVTGAQNAGRMDSYAAASERGIRLKREWVATLDNRTRHAHAMLDGTKVDMNEPFKVDGYKIMFPGDRSAPGYLIYNCRCTMVAAVDDIDSSDAMRRARDPETGESVLIKNMTYREWAEWKKSENSTAWDTYIKKGRDVSADKRQMAEYRAVLGNKVPNNLDAFQRMKYNEPGKWAEAKEHYRYKKRVPAATKKDFENYRKVKATGVVGTIRVPPEPINIEQLAFADAHGMRHGCTLDDAKHYVKTAKCTVRRHRWDGVSINCYALDGATYLNAETLEIKTAFSKNDFDPIIQAIAEVFK